MGVASIRLSYTYKSLSLIGAKVGPSFTDRIISYIPNHDTRTATYIQSSMKLATMAVSEEKNKTLNMQASHNHAEGTAMPYPLLISQTNHQ